MAHLTIHDRVKIEVMIKSGYSISKIADELDKAYSTISHEIKKHTLESEKVLYRRILK